MSENQELTNLEQLLDRAGETAEGGGRVPLEVIPFSANVAGAALTAFGLSLIAHDGILALFAFAFTIATFGLVVYNLI